MKPDAVALNLGVVCRENTWLVHCLSLAGAVALNLGVVCRLMEKSPLQGAVALNLGVVCRGASVSCSFH